MLDFKHYLKAYCCDICLPELGTYTRKSMPQVDDVDELLTYFSLHGIAYDTTTTRLVTDIKFTQSELNHNKIRDMLLVPKSELVDKTFIVSSDGYLLDGHHTIAALFNKHKSIKVPVITVNLLRDELIAMAGTFSKSRYEDLTEGVLDVLKSAKRKANDLYNNILRSKDMLGMEYSETKDMVGTFLDMLQHKLANKSRPTDADVLNAIEQLKDVGRMAILAPLFALPGGVPITITIELLAKRYGKTILPSSFQMRECLKDI